jgi:hypothetical protein
MIRAIVAAVVNLEQSWAVKAFVGAVVSLEQSWAVEAFVGVVPNAAAREAVISRDNLV